MAGGAHGSMLPFSEDLPGQAGFPSARQPDLQQWPYNLPVLSIGQNLLSLPTNPIPPIVPTLGTVPGQSAASISGGASDISRGREVSGLPNLETGQVYTSAAGQRKRSSFESESQLDFATSAHFPPFPVSEPSTKPKHPALERNQQRSFNNSLPINKRILNKLQNFLCIIL